MMNGEDLDIKSKHCENENFCKLLKIRVMQMRISVNYWKELSVCGQAKWARPIAPFPQNHHLFEFPHH